MSKYTFICEEGGGLITGYGSHTKTTVEFKADDLETVLNHFEMFLRGAGFTFEGNLDFVDDEQSTD